MPGLAGTDRKAVLNGNLLADRAYDYTLTAYERGIPGIEENPYNKQSSLESERPKALYQSWWDR